MNKQIKLVLSIIGLGAIIVPAVLLIFLSKKAPPEPEASSGSRQIDTETIREAVDKAPQNPTFQTPAPSTPSAFPTFEGSPSAR